MIEKSLFQYNKRILRVSQLAAISVFDHIGKKNEEAADKSAVESMRKELNKIDFRGTVVIGEGERDKAPMLYIGEKVGSGKGMKVDIALDPLEGTKITANNQKNALTVLAIGNNKSFLHAPDVYMEKIAVGPGLPDNFIDLDFPLEKILKNLSKERKKKLSDIVVCVLDRPRHEKIFKILDKNNCKKFLIPDGDILGAISTALKKKKIDMYIGIGGAPEGVLAAAALKCLGGQMQCRLVFSEKSQEIRAKKMGISDLNKKYSINDLVKKDVIFAASGVTDGSLLKGIKKKVNRFTTNSFNISTKTKKIDFIESDFKIP